MRDWLVGGAVLEVDGRLLLVQNRRRNGSHDWSPPGGVIDAGESTLEGLTREVREETGLEVIEWVGPVYEIVAEAPDMGWRLRVEAYVAAAYRGEVFVDDPDGIVVDACFADAETAAAHLAACQPWVREPLLEFLAERWDGARRFIFDVAGATPADLVVTRRDQLPTSDS